MTITLDTAIAFASLVVAVMTYLQSAFKKNLARKTLF